MSEPAVSDPEAEAAPPFPSLEAMRDEHSDLLKRQRESGSSQEFLHDVQSFLDRGQATGSQLDLDNDRSTAQTLLDYWATALFRATKEEMPEVALAEFDPESGGELADELCPYARLGELSQQATALYFGWQRLIGECLERLNRFHLVAVVGAAGSGRSSLANVGLLQALRAGAIPGSETWQYFPTVVPGTDPLTSLARATAPPGKEVGDWVAQHTRGFRRDPDHLARVLHETGVAASVLLVDQFEEVFSHCGDKHDRQAFIDNLLGAAKSSTGWHAVILVIRSDFASQVGQFESLQQLVQRDQAQVPMAFTTSELRQAIEEPAKRVGLRFDEGLVDQLLLDIQGDPAALSLLQFTLLQMWEHRERNRITWDVYRQLGAGRLALERTAEAVFKALSRDEQETARRILLQLVRPGEGQEISCVTLRRDQLHRPGEPSERVDRVLDEFVRARLLRFTPASPPASPQSGEIAVAHESLVGRWTRLQNWLDEERDTRRRRMLLTGAAHQWHEKGRDPGALWRGSILEEAAMYRDLTDLETQFVRASERAETKRTTRRIQLYAAATLATIVVAAVLVFLSKRHEAELSAKMMQLITERGFRLFEEGDLSGSVLWSMEAWRSEEGYAPLQQVHRARVGAGLSQMPRLARQWADEKLFASCVEFSPDGRYLAVSRGSADGNQGQVQIWNAQSDETKTLSIDPNSGAVNWISFSPDGRYLVTAGGRRGGKVGQLQVWETETGKRMGSPLPLTGAAINAAFDPSGDLIVCAAEENHGTQGKALIWNWQTGISKSLVENGKGPVNHAAFSRDGRRAAISTEDRDANTGEARVVDVETGLDICPALAHGGGVNWASFSPDATGQYVVTASGEQSADTGEARVWDTSTGAPRTPVLLHSSGVVYASFSPNSIRVVTASHDGSARLWDATTGRELHSFSHKSSVFRASFSPDGRYLATASRDRTARVWDVYTGEAVTPLLFHLGTVSTLTFSPNGLWLATSSRNTAQIWNLDTGGRPPTMLNTDGSVKHVTCSGDGLSIITTSDDVIAQRDSVKIWDLEGGKLVAELKPVAEVSVAAISPDGRFAATVSTRDADAKSMITISNVPSGEQQTTAEIDGLVTFATFSPAPEHLLMTVSRQLHAETDTAPYSLDIHDALTGARAANAVLNEAVNYAAFSPNGRLVVVASGDIKAKTGTARVFKTSSGKLVSEFKQHSGGVIHASFSPNGRQVVTAGADDRAWIWDASTAKPSHEPLQHTADVTHASFSQDGKRVLTVSYDPFKTRVWETETGKLLAGIEHGVKATLSRDGRRAVTTGRDGIAKVWDVDSKLLIAELKHPGEVQSAVFSSDEESVMTACYILSRGDDVGTESPVLAKPKRLIRTQTWRIAEPRSIDELRAYVHLISSRKIDRDKVGLLPLDTESLDNVRAQLSPRFFSDLLTRPSREFYLEEANNREAIEQWFEAAWHLERAIAERPEPPDAEVFARLGWAYSQLGRWDDAIKSYSDAISLDTDNWARWSYRAWANLRARNWIQAKDDYDRAIQLEPGHAELLTQRATALSELGQWDKAAADLAQVTTLRPDDHEAWHHFAVANLAQNNTEAYRQVCAKILEKFDSEQSPESANDLAWACVLARDAVPDPSRIVRLAQNTIQNDPQNYYYLNTLGAALYRAGEYEASIQQLREAMRSHTGQFLAQVATTSPAQQTNLPRPLFDEQGTPYDWFFMAMAKHRQGNTDDARDWFFRATRWVDQRTSNVPEQRAITATPLTAFEMQELSVLRQEAELVLKEHAPPK